MKFVDYKCNDCNEINEYYVSNNEEGKLSCLNCGSNNLARVFSSVQCRCDSGAEAGDSGYASGRSCSGSCSACSGCS